MLMKCPNCQTENLSDSVFCEECSAPLEAACPSCGAGNRPSAKFCRKCRASLGVRGPDRAAGEAAEGSAAASPSPRSPASYTPKHLADRILTSRAALEGERKQVTVLFADIKGSMELAQAVDPEELHRIMDRFFEVLADGVHRFEGTVNQYTGDGIMALFGAPIAHEDHAQRACYAALHLVEALRDYAIELRREHGLDFSVRMGINSGDVVVGKIGDDLRMDYTAQGHTVGLAARMQTLAEPGKVYLTGQAAERVKGYFELEDLGSFNVKGVSELVPVFNLASIGRVRTRFDLSRARGLTRFVGRTSDMQVLETALASARSGKGRAVGVVAPAGVGKSRLCFEFAERCRTQGMTILYGSGVAHGKNVPLLPILDIFRAYFGIDERDDPRTAREKIAGRLLLIDERFRDVLPIVFDFLGVPDPARPAPSVDPEARQRRIVAVMRRLVETGSQRGFLIVIEDLHWLDPASDFFVAEYVDAIAHGPGLLLLNFRPEYHADWMQKSWYQQLPLDPLGPEAVHELLRDLLGEDSSVAGLADRIHERTQGNPYFTEEIVRSLVESRVLGGTRGAYRLKQSIETIEVPYSVHAVLAARIDRLAEREKDVLQAAAVIGKEFAEPVLAAVCALPATDLAGALAMLQNAEFISQQVLYPIAEYAFAHPLTQEVALSSQLGEQRRRTHAAVARALEAGEREGLDQHAALIAHHYEEAGSEVDAARWHGRAAVWMGSRDFAGALRHWQRVWDLLTALPETSQTDETRGARLAASAQIVIGGWRLGMAETAMWTMYEEGCALAEGAGAVEVLAALRGGYAARLASLGRVREALAMNEESLRYVDAVSAEIVLRAGARVGTAYYRYQLGRLEEALAMVEEGCAMIGADLQAGRERFGFSYAIWFVGTKAIVSAMLGRCAEAVTHLEQALRISRESDIAENLGWSYSNVAFVSQYTGETSYAGLGDALVCAQEAVRIAEETGSTFSRVVAYSNLGACYAAFGQWEAADRVTSDVLGLSRERRVGLEFEILNLAALSRTALGRGDAARARRLAEEAIALGQERGQKILVMQYVALARALCAEHGQRARDAVENALRAAAISVAETGARGLEPLIPEARAELARVCGDAAAHDYHLREAYRIYEAIGASGHAARLAKELGCGVVRPQGGSGSDARGEDHRGDSGVRRPPTLLRPATD
jgi:class 3 adenylate cyclase/tetratricopeptide (TPR) repeat protein